MSAAKGKKQQQQQQQQGAKKTPVASPSASPAAKTSTPAPAATTPAPAPASTSAPAPATATPTKAAPTPAPAPAATSTSTPAKSAPAATKSASKPSTPAQKEKPKADATNEGEEKKGARNNNNTDASSARTDLTDTAAHILKGAIVSVLGKDAAVTDSVNWKGANKGILNIRWSGDTIPQDTIGTIQTRANEIIRANLPIEQIQMERSVAEEKYNKERVNHTYIYDAKEPPASVTTVTLTHIPGYNINCCRGPHHATTGAVIAIALVKPKRRANGGTYEFTYVCGEAALKSVQSDAAPTSTATSTSASAPAATTTSKSSKSKPATTTPTSLINTSKKSHVDVTLDDVVNTVLSTLKESDIQVNDEQQKELDARLRAHLHRTLTMFGNSSFANGYKDG